MEEPPGGRPGVQDPTCTGYLGEFAPTRLSGSAKGCMERRHDVASGRCLRITSLRACTGDWWVPAMPPPRSGTRPKAGKGGATGPPSNDPGAKSPLFHADLEVHPKGRSRNATSLCPALKGPSFTRRR